ncbi:MAG: hypothetical protein ACE37D_20425 [Pseudomonadales bacterium]
MHQKTFDALYEQWLELMMLEDHSFNLNPLPIQKNRGLFGR